MDILFFVLGRLFMALPLTIIWTFFSYLITYALYKIKDKDIPESYTETFNYRAFTDYIMISLYLIIFYK